MLGEFIGLHKTPDFKLNAQSSQAITEAVAAESRHYSMSMNCSPSETGRTIAHQRSFSANTHETADFINMDPSYRRLSEPTHFSSFTPPRQRHFQQRSLLHPRKKKARKQNSLSNFFGKNDKEVIIDNDHVSMHQQQKKHIRRGSETFCGSVAAYSNNLSTINTRL
uniref:Uncharacterized protein n=1 Tax=Setaria digitata TaxID=48799 RepID=A0A915PYH2_9BILA